MATEQNKAPTREEIEAEQEAKVKSDLLPLQNQMDEISARNPEVVKFLNLATEFKAKEKILKKEIQAAMEEHGIKSIKGSWGYMTIVEKSNYKAVNIDDMPSQFIKKALDTAKVAAHLKLKSKLPKGVETNPSRNLTISLKPREVKE